MKFRYETNDLILQPLDENHASIVLDFYNRNRLVFDAYEPDKPDNFYTLDFQRRLLKAEFEGFIHGKYIRFYLFDKNIPNKIIGTISFSDIRRNAFFSCQTGYKIDSDYVKRGYGYQMLSESIKIMVSESNMHRIVAYILPENQASIKLAQKLGFELEGIAKSYVLLHGVWTDHLRYVYITPDTV